MPSELSSIRTWKTWREPITADDSSLLLIMGSGGVVGRVIAAYPYSAIAVQVIGKGSDNDSATVTIVGRMDDDTKYGAGPPTPIWKGQVLLGARSSGATVVPLRDGKWGDGSTWFWADTFDISGVSGGHNMANAVTLAGGGYATFMLPTLGYTHLEMHIADVGGGGTEMAEVGVLYREIAMGGVV